MEQSTSFRKFVMEVFKDALTNWTPTESSVPPETSTSFELLNDERVLFYQRWQLPKSFMKDESEVVVSDQRVVLTKLELVRFPWSGSLNPVSRRQQQVDVRCIRGYDSLVVVPHLCSLVKKLFLLCFALFLLNGGLDRVGRNVFVLLINAQHLPWLMTFWGGPCKAFGLFCASPSRQTPSFLQSEGSVPSIPWALRKYAKQTERRASFTLNPLGDILMERMSTATEGCTDFETWVDADGDNCSAYARPGWALTCVPGRDASGVSSDEKFELRRDPSVLQLSPKEACCVCGGGDATARAKALTELKPLLWALIESEAFKLNNEPLQDGGTNGTLRTELTRAFQMGFTLLDHALESTPSRQLVSIGKALTGISVFQIAGGSYELSPAVGNVMRQLLAAMKSLTPAQIMSEQSLQVRKDPLQVASDWGAYTMIIARELGRCLVRIISIILIFWCVLSITSWFSERFYSSRVYVVLRMHTDHCDCDWPTANKCKPPLPGDDLNSCSVVGFYLPDTVKWPSRLKDFAAALQVSAKN